MKLYLVLNNVSFREWAFLGSNLVKDGLEIIHNLQMLLRTPNCKITHTSQLSSEIAPLFFSTAHFRYFNNFSLLLQVLVVNRFRLRVCVSVCLERAWVYTGSGL